MKRQLSIVLLGVSVFAIAAKTIEAATELARINNTVISLEDFNKKYRENLKFFQFKVPTRKGVLDDLIKRELGIQEAKRTGLEKDPEVVDRMNTVLYHALLDKRLSKEFEAIKVTDSEAQAYYKNTPELRTSHIFVALRPDATPDEQRKAFDKIKDIETKYVKPKKMSFAEVAQRYSEGVAAPMGGDVDYQMKDKLDPVYYETARKLPLGGNPSPIVRTQFGYHIIKKTGVRPWDETDKAQVKRMLFDERRNQIFERFMTQLRNQAKVTIRSELIKE